MTRTGDAAHVPTYNPVGDGRAAVVDPAELSRNESAQMALPFSECKQGMYTSVPAKRRRFRRGTSGARDVRSSAM